MRTLVVGAGALGGYIGARLLEAGRDVASLVRPGREAALTRNGSVVKSPLGDKRRTDPPLLQAEQIRSSYDLVILACKSYDLESAMDSFSAAVGPKTAILPLLNGMRHLDSLSARFGSETVSAAAA